MAEKYGWEAVNCYVQEPLACDSDDEKRIRRAVILEAQTESELGLVELYDRLGMLEHDLNADMNSGITDLVDIHGLTVASSPARDSPVEGPVFVKGWLGDHLSF